MICHYCGADHAEDIVCQPMRQILDDCRVVSSSSDHASTPATGGEKSLNGQVESPSASNLPPSAGSNNAAEMPHDAVADYEAPVL